METCGFTLYKTFDFDWFFTFSVRDYPIQKNSLFLRGTGRLKNLKSPAQKKIPIWVVIVCVQAQSLQYKREFRKYLRPETYPKSFAFKPPDPPPKKGLFLGGSLPSNIFSILEIRLWFKIWKTWKVSFGSIWNILVNTWSTPIVLIRNEIWKFWKKCKKCTFSKIQNFQTLLNQNLDVFSMNNVFSGNLERVEWCF